MSHLSSYPHLSTILGVYPQCENHCYGYAVSQRRRCKLPTRRDNRDRAFWLLNEGTRLLQRGFSIDSLLIELAPLVLCTRWHQNQADNLVGDWRAKLRAFEEQSVLAAVLKSLREHANSQARLARSAGEQRVTERVSRPTRSERSAAIETGEEGRENREEGPSPSRTSTETSSPAVVNRAAEEPTVPQRERRTTRKPIEGDCGICMCPLRGQDSEEDDEGSNVDREEDGDNDDENENDVSGTASDNEDRDGPEEENLDDLVYCRNQCGTNYHKACIDQWIATFENRRGSPTCPTCRAVWSS
ncbi:uncharacterized protein CDV56_105297 [Aspergillus thermomutatus]|uniref:RING-type domain-containing protein n=1 Tax=Aspergillus thermomutatus TaxID=41047 RepID=A0A397GB39_ASPTH|nr:uncharacterized protein CDV56_105297 [Aspergillus thermomutatus]RHZ48232.1 hypothetical protein CDV56_105297 [Aspergillus thermomutatus]